MIDICCATCSKCLPLVKYNYSDVSLNGSELLDGYICLRYGSKEEMPIPHASWVVGVDPTEGLCRQYEFKGGSGKAQWPRK